MDGISLRVGRSHPFRLYVSASVLALTLLALCVSAAEAGRFRRVVNGAVLDKVSGVVWEERGGGLMSWQDAVDYCENLVIAGADDWALPDREHLEVLVNGGIQLEKSTHWTATVFAKRPTHAWHIPFEDNGDVSTFHKDRKHHVRCVRLSSLRDTIRPGTPAGIRMATAGGNHITLSWEQAHDFGGVSRYVVYRNGKEIGTAYANCRYEDKDVDPGFSYCYQVRAVDNAGNVSDPTSEICETARAAASLYIDPSTGLIAESDGRMWQARTDGGIHTWFEASGLYHDEYNPEGRDLCGELTEGGFSDWRLPSREEVEAFLRLARQQSGKRMFPYLDIAGGSASIWTSTVSQTMNNGAFCIHVRSGDAFCSDMGQRKEVLCTRDLDSGGYVVEAKK